MPLKTAASGAYSFYWSQEERSKTARRTREWTIRQLEHFGVAPPSRVLSVGCGNGQDVMTLREAGYLSFGVDLNFSGYPGSLFAIASGAELPFDAGLFDAVVSLEVIEHVDLDSKANRRLFAEELQRVTKPGGVIVIATPNRYFPIDEHGDPIRLHSPFESQTLSFAELCDLFSDCTAHPISPANYFAFRRFAHLAGEWCPKALERITVFLGSATFHASPLNPHLYVAFVSDKRGTNHEVGG